MHRLERGRKARLDEDEDGKKGRKEGGGRSELKLRLSS